MTRAQKKLIIITGKGGVGKSLAAAAVALREARKGLSVCLIEVGSQSHYEALFETRGVGYEPTELFHGVQVAKISPDECLKEYTLHYLKIPKLYELLFENRVMKTFLNAAPALADIAILGKITCNIRDVIPMDFDVLVVDGYSSGQLKSMLKAPEQVRQLIKTGIVYEQVQGIFSALSDTISTQFCIVTVPEEMAVTEVLELGEHISSKYNQQIEFICNRVLEAPISSDQQLELLKKVKSADLKQFIEYLRVRTQYQERQIARLKSKAHNLKQIKLIFNYNHGQELVERFCEQLETYDN